jgi:hypothetical protein
MKMPQPMPIVRQLYGPALIPQFIAIAALCALARLVLPSASLVFVLAVGAFAYLISCRLLRAIFTGDHIRGMEAYRAGRFGDAIDHFQASYNFFQTHRYLDACRWIIFGVASRNSYRIIALANMAYCHGQLSAGARAIELYEQVLRECPEHPIAKASLNMLRAGAGQAGAKPLSC